MIEMATEDVHLEHDAAIMYNSPDSIHGDVITMRLRKKSEQLVTQCWQEVDQRGHINSM